MSYSNQSIYVDNPFLSDIYSDFTTDEIRRYDFCEDNFNFPSGFHNFRQVKGYDDYDQSFPFAQIDETAECFPYQYKAMKRNAAYMEMYPNQQHPQQMPTSYDRNRNATKMYNNFGSNYSKEFNENVASPTISSSCEPEKVSGSLQAGYTGNENIVHSTTSNSQQGQATSQSSETKSVNIETEEILKELDSNSSLLGATKLEKALPAELIGLTRSDDRTSGKFKAEKIPDESIASSPNVKHAAKRLRTMESYTDVIERVNEEIAYLGDYSMFGNIPCNSSTSAVPYRFSVDQYPHNNINQPVDKQKLSFNFAGTSTDRRIDSQPNCNSNPSNYMQSNVGEMNPTYTLNNRMGNYASCSQQITSTPNKMRPKPDCVQMQRTPSSNLNSQHAGIPDNKHKQANITDRPSYCDDPKYTQSPRKTPLTYHNLDDPSDSTPFGHRQSNDARNWTYECSYSRNPNLRSVDSEGSEEPTMPLYYDQGMQRLMHDERIAEHPLYPLLRDILINDQKFYETIEPFHFANFLPERFNDLLKNYYARNRISPSDYVIEPEIDALVVQATMHAHATLVDKMKKRKLRGGFLVQVTKPPVPDINSLCDVMSRSNDLGSSGTVAHCPQQGMISTNPMPQSIPGNAHILVAPPTSPTEITTNYYPPNSMYSGSYQRDPTVNASTTSQHNNPNNHYQPLTPTSKLRNNYYHHPTTNQHDYNQPYSQSQPLYNNNNNFYSNHQTSNHGDSFGMLYQSAYNSMRPPIAKQEPAFYPGDFTRPREIFDPRAMMPHEQMMYGMHPHLVRLVDGDRGLPCSPRRMGRGNPPMMMVKQEIEVEKKGKNKVLPKEAVAIMEDWLRKHEENPYPNDEEKEVFMNQTKLTINQINYWFTNARRRKLPKWNTEKLQAQERMRNPQPNNQRADEEL